LSFAVALVTNALALAICAARARLLARTSGWSVFGVRSGRVAFRFRLIDMAGSELGIIEWPAESVALGDFVKLPDGRLVPVVDVYDDEYGREGGVQATLAVDDGS
jgi:hypothetical protein